MLQQAPLIETARLRLRHHTKADYPILVKMWADPEIYRYIGGVAFSAQQTWARLLAIIGHWSIMGFGYWAVEDKATGKFAGQIGFANHERGIELLEGYPEMGWIVAPEFHGRGYASEGIQATLDWADKIAGYKKTVCIISPDNAPSIKLAQKFRFKKIREVLYQANPTSVFARTI